MSRALAALAVAAWSGCGGATGTVHIDVVEPPGSGLLDDIQSARLTLTVPRKVVEAERDGDGNLSLDLELPAVPLIGFVELEGFDTSGELIAFGRSGPLPLNATEAEIEIYLGPPGSLSEAPEALEPARTAVGGTGLSFGVLLAGGVDADGAARPELAIYNVYEHELQIGDDMPEPAGAPAVAAGSFSFVYLFGGERDGAPVADTFRFDTDVGPAGLYSELTGDEPELARAGATAAQVGQELFLVSGDPAVEIDGVAGTVQAIESAPPLAGPLLGIPVELEGRVQVLALGDGVGSTGAVLLRNNMFTALDPPADALRTGHTLALLPDGDILAVGGEIAGAPVPSAVRYDPVTQVFVVIDDLLATPRRAGAIATTTEYLLVAGGVDASGNLIATGELFDAVTLDPIGEIPMVVPRAGATAIAMVNGQILIAGGTDAAGAPVGLIELFNPAP